MRVSRSLRAALLAPALLLTAVAPGAPTVPDPRAFASGPWLEWSMTPGTPRESGPPEKAP